MTTRIARNVFRGETTKLLRFGKWMNLNVDFLGSDEI